jgi:hypothetical protein
MTRNVKLLLAAAVTGSLLGGGIAGAAVTQFMTVAAQAATASPSPNPNASPGTFHSNEDPAHEAQESAQQEAAENSGQFPGPHGACPPGAGAGRPAPAPSATPSPGA